ncbi:hypothetical protein KUF71_003421 [Frankliniella fusca]|uniref:DUF7869 domain-containing protein n=1 Tax=Frankliniella fusca TaxID=407009 RepID=A0AAE1L7M5_9NEOP|nr:hypothetical protein KUF71_003421 [Frankliniella fusca]
MAEPHVFDHNGLDQRRPEQPRTPITPATPDSDGDYHRDKKSPIAKRQLFADGLRSPPSAASKPCSGAISFKSPASNNSALKLISEYSFTDESDIEDNDSQIIVIHSTPITSLPKGGKSIYQEPVHDTRNDKSSTSLDPPQQLNGGSIFENPPTMIETSDGKLIPIVLNTSGIELDQETNIPTDQVFETPNDNDILNNIMQTEVREGHQLLTDELEGRVIPTQTILETLNETVIFNEQTTEVDVEATPKRKSRERTISSSPVRKRKRDENLWKRNVNKTLKNSGQPYISAKGKEYDGAKMREPCSCSMDCVHRITQEQRQEVHEKFWKLGDHERQWDFIRSNSKCSATKSANDEENKRKVSRSYSFTVGGDKIKVCKRMFMSTLGIWDSWIATAYNKINPEKGFTIPPDKRGRHVRKPTQVTPEKIESVKQHVNLFPKVPSHYCRKRTKREYLERGLSVSKMAFLYSKWAAENNLSKSAIATRRQYRDILNSNFNIGFFKPKKDQCSLCSLMRNKSNNRQVREAKKDLWVAHVKNKTKSRALKEKDKNEAIKDKSIAVCSFDLQKQLTCPKSEDSAMYYRSKLNVYNFTVFDHVGRNGTCFLWHEGIGKKGSSEISSSLLQVIRDLVKHGHNDIRFYSDNCAGQNKNRFLFAMYLHLCVKYSIKITHRYLEPGHTQMEADSIHGNIERSTERQDIFDFDGWVEAIEQAKTSLPKYKVKLLSQKSIFSYQGNIELSANTVKDLTYLCDNLHVPLGKQTFLRNVLAGVNPVEEEEVTDLEYESTEEICQSDAEDKRNDTEENTNSAEEDQDLEEV